MGSVNSDGGYPNPWALRPELPYKEERDHAVRANGMGASSGRSSAVKNRDFCAISIVQFSQLSLRGAVANAQGQSPFVAAAPARFSPRLRYAARSKFPDWAMRAPAAPERLPRICE